MLTCGEFGAECAVEGRESPSESRDTEIVQTFIDLSGYLWVAVTSYQFSASGVVPHWVSLFKSDDPFTCAAINAAGSAGLEVTTTYVACSGLAAGYATGECTGAHPPLVDMTGATVTVRVFGARGECCDGSIEDPCNPPPAGTCDGGYDPVECPDACDPDGMVHGALSMEIGVYTGATIPGSVSCLDLLGTYIVPFFRCEFGRVIYFQEFIFDPPVDGPGGTLWKLGVAIALTRTGVDPFRQTCATVSLFYHYTDAPNQFENLTGCQVAECMTFVDLLANPGGGALCAITATLNGL